MVEYPFPDSGTHHRVRGFLQLTRYINYLLTYLFSPPKTQQMTYCHIGNFKMA